MFFDIFDMTSAYFQQLLLLMRISPDIYPDFFSTPYNVLKILMVELLHSVGEKQRYNNPLQVALPEWLPLDVRLQFFLICAVAPLALATLGVLSLYTKLGYLMDLLTLGSLFGFLFGFFLLTSRGGGHQYAAAPGSRTSFLLMGLLAPTFVGLVVFDFLHILRKHRKASRVHKDRLLAELLKQKRTTCNTTTDSLGGVVIHTSAVDAAAEGGDENTDAKLHDERLLNSWASLKGYQKQKLSPEALAAETLNERQMQISVECLNLGDCIVQFSFGVALLLVGMFFVNAIPFPSTQDLQGSVASRALGGILIAAAGVALAWGVLGCFRRGREIRSCLAKYGRGKLITLIMICTNFLYSSMVTNFVSLVYCQQLGCTVGSRPSSARSSFPVLFNATVSSHSSSVTAGCIACNTANFKQQCPKALENSFCAVQRMERRLFYDVRVPCDLVDGHYKAASVLISFFYILYVPVLQYLLATCAVDILQMEFPLQQRFVDALSAKEQYFERVITSKNSASFVYRAYKPQFRYYKLSFLLQKIVLASVSIVTRREHASVGILVFVFVPALAMAFSIGFRPFTRPTERVYFPALQLMLALAASISVYGNARAHQGGIPEWLGILLAVLLIGVPVVTLIVATIMTLQMERRRYKLLRRRLESTFANRIIGMNDERDAMAELVGTLSADASRNAVYQRRGSTPQASAAAAAAGAAAVVVAAAAPTHRERGPREGGPEAGKASDQPSSPRCLHGGEERPCVSRTPMNRRDISLSSVAVDVAHGGETPEEEGRHSPHRKEGEAEEAEKADNHHPPLDGAGKPHRFVLQRMKSAFFRYLVGTSFHSHNQDGSATEQQRRPPGGRGGKATKRRTRHHGGSRGGRCSSDEREDRRQRRRSSLKPRKLWNRKDVQDTEESMPTLASPRTGPADDDEERGGGGAGDDKENGGSAENPLAFPQHSPFFGADGNPPAVSAEREGENRTPQSGDRRHRLASVRVDEADSDGRDAKSCSSSSTVTATAARGDTDGGSEGDSDSGVCGCCCRNRRATGRGPIAGVRRWFRVCCCGSNENSEDEDSGERPEGGEQGKEMDGRRRNNGGNTVDISPNAEYAVYKHRKLMFFPEFFFSREVATVAYSRRRTWMLYLEDFNVFGRPHSGGDQNSRRQRRGGGGKRPLVPGHGRGGNDKRWRQGLPSALSPRALASESVSGNGSGTSPSRGFAATTAVSSPFRSRKANSSYRKERRIPGETQPNRNTSEPKGAKVVQCVHSFAAATKSFLRTVVEWLCAVVGVPCQQRAGGANSADNVALRAKARARRGKAMQLQVGRYASLLNYYDVLITRLSCNGAPLSERTASVHRSVADGEWERAAPHRGRGGGRTHQEATYAAADLGVEASNHDGSSPPIAVGGGAKESLAIRDGELALLLRLKQGLAEDETLTCHDGNSPGDGSRWASASSKNSSRGRSHNLEGSENPQSTGRRTSTSGSLERLDEHSFSSFRQEQLERLQGILQEKLRTSDRPTWWRSKDDLMQTCKEPGNASPWFFREMAGPAPGEEWDACGEHRRSATSPETVSQTIKAALAEAEGEGGVSQQPPSSSASLLSLLSSSSSSSSSSMPRCRRVEPSIVDALSRNEGWGDVRDDDDPILTSSSTQLRTAVLHEREANMCFLAAQAKLQLAQRLAARQEAAERHRRVGRSYMDGSPCEGARAARRNASVHSGRNPFHTADASATVLSNTHTTQSAVAAVPASSGFPDSVQQARRDGSTPTSAAASSAANDGEEERNGACTAASVDPNALGWTILLHYWREPLLTTLYEMIPERKVDRCTGAVLPLSDDSDGDGDDGKRRSRLKSKGPRSVEGESEQAANPEEASVIGGGGIDGGGGGRDDGAFLFAHGGRENRKTKRRARLGSVVVDTTFHGAVVRLKKDVSSAFFFGYLQRKVCCMEKGEEPSAGEEEESRAKRGTPLAGTDSAAEVAHMESGVSLGVSRSHHQASCSEKADGSAPLAEAQLRRSISDAHSASNTEGSRNGAPSLRPGRESQCVACGPVNSERRYISVRIPPRFLRARRGSDEVLEGETEKQFLSGFPVDCQRQSHSHRNSKKLSNTGAWLSDEDARSVVSLKSKRGGRCGVGNPFCPSDAVTDGDALLAFFLGIPLSAVAFARPPGTSPLGAEATVARSGGEWRQGGKEDNTAAFLRSHYLLRQKLRTIYWDEHRELTKVQRAVDHKINAFVRRLLTILLTFLGLFATIALTLTLVGMFNTVDLNYLPSSGVTTEKARSLSFNLAGYRSWADFTSHCCCTAEKDMNASFPFYLLDVEEWLCENGKIKERVRRDGFDGVVHSGYTVRDLCGMVFLNRCRLEVDTKTQEVALVGCDGAVVDPSAAERW